MNKKINGELLKQETFGVEIETYNLGREECARITKEYFEQKYLVDTRYWYDGSHLGNYKATDHLGREWQFERDSSITGNNPCEIVTPILTYADIEDLQELVRIFRRNGAKSNSRHTCGVHIHVGARGHTGKSIRNLVNLMASKEDLIKKAIGFSTDREGYSKNISRRFLEDLNKKKPKEIETVKRVFYGNTVGYDASSDHYSPCRYYNLNLHAIWDKGTTEFRMFEFHRNLHAGELKAYIQLCLAMVSYSRITNYTSFNRVNFNNEKNSMKNWLVNMGLVGDEFKTCRKMLLKRLEGDSAYRNGRPRVDTLDDLNLAD